MPDDDDWLILTPDQMGFGVLNPARDVLVSLDLGAWTQFVGRKIAIRMTPSEARMLAEKLARKAAEAETKPSQQT